MSDPPPPEVKPPLNRLPTLEEVRKSKTQANLAAASQQQTAQRAQPGPSRSAESGHGRSIGGGATPNRNQAGTLQAGPSRTSTEQIPMAGMVQSTSSPSRQEPPIGNRISTQAGGSHPQNTADRAGNQSSEPLGITPLTSPGPEIVTTKHVYLNPVDIAQRKTVNHPKATSRSRPSSGSRAPSGRPAKQYVHKDGTLGQVLQMEQQRIRQEAMQKTAAERNALIGMPGSSGTQVPVIHAGPYSGVPVRLATNSQNGRYVYGNPRPKAYQAVGTTSASATTSQSQSSSRTSSTQMGSGAGPSQSNMRPVTVVSRSAPLAAPQNSGTGKSQANSNNDDHKFKKPMLPARHRQRASQATLDEERRKRECMDDARRVQMHVMEATRKSQEAAAASAASRASSSNQRSSSSHHRANYRQASAERQKTTTTPTTTTAPIAPPAKEPEPLPIEEDTQPAELNNEVLEVPNLLVHSNFIFRLVISKQAYRMLSTESRENLKQFLPKFETPEEENTILDCAFTRNQMLTGGNPIDTVQRRMKQGWYHPDTRMAIALNRESNKVMYDHYIRNYHFNLCRKLLVSRTLMLKVDDETSLATKAEVGFPLQPDNPETERKLKKFLSMKKRAAKRSRMMLVDCRAKTNDHMLSSDDDEDVGPPISKALMMNNTHRSTLYLGKSKDLDLHQPLQMDDVKTMLKKYKKLKRTNPKCPTLKIKGIKMEEVFERAGILPQADKIKETVAALEKELGGATKPSKTASSRQTSSKTATTKTAAAKATPVKATKSPASRAKTSAQPSPARRPTAKQTKVTLKVPTPPKKAASRSRRRR